MAILNEDIKRGFIASRENIISPHAYLERWLLHENKIPKYENRKGKDISMFTHPEIIDMYKSLQVGCRESLVVLNNMLVHYTNYCINENLVEDGQNHFLETEPTDYMNCVNSLVIEQSFVTREEILDLFSRLNNPSDKFAFLALFEGLKGNNFCELSHLVIEDFDFKKNSVKVRYLTTDKISKKEYYAYREVPISKELISFAKSAAEADIYEPLVAQVQRSITLVKDQNWIIARFGTQRVNTDYAYGRVIYRRFIKALEWLGYEKSIKLNSISDSGKIHMLNQIAKEHGCSGRDVLYNKELRQEVEKQFNIEIVQSVFFHKYQQFLIKK